MDTPTLNKAALDKSIEAIEKIDYSICTIQEIDQLLLPLFNGYKTSAFKFNSGTYVNRTRICAKPENIREVSFPPPEKAVMGRASEKGQPIFYASIGRAVPFFELDPAIGDSVVISTWRTTEEMILNQIGYTRETAAKLRSARDFENLLEFRKDMLSFGDDNETVYGFLARCFTRKISADQTDLYKLTIPIARRLMAGDLFHGMFYPTVKMFGNADNVALKTDFVLQALKLVSVEYARISGRTDENFNIEMLDTAIVWDKDGNIEWSGRLLGWNVTGHSNKKFSSEAGEWISRDEEDRRVDPVPTRLIDTDPSPMLLKFNNAYPKTLKNDGDNQISGPYETVRFRYAVHYDFDAKEKFISFYIPRSKSPFDIAKTLAGTYDQFYNLDKTVQAQFISSNKKNPELSVTSDELKDLRFIHFFTEDYIDVLQLGQQVISGYILKMESGSPAPIGYTYIYREVQKKI